MKKHSQPLYLINVIMKLYQTKCNPHASMCNVHTTQSSRIFSPNFHIETKEEVYVQLSFLTFVSDRPMHISQKLAASLDVYRVLWYRPFSVCALCTRYCLAKIHLWSFMIEMVVGSIPGEDKISQFIFHKD